MRVWHQNNFFSASTPAMTIKTFFVEIHPKQNLKKSQISGDCFFTMCIKTRYFRKSSFYFPSCDYAVLECVAFCAFLGKKFFYQFLALFPWFLELYVENRGVSFPWSFITCQKIIFLSENTSFSKLGTYILGVLWVFELTSTLFLNLSWLI